MDLKSGSLFWPSVDLVPPADPPLREAATCEVAILGGGVTGALVGYHLAKAGVDAILLDRRPVGQGSTVASTGILQYEIDTPLVDLARRVGRESAVRAYRLSLAAVEAFDPLVQELGDGCDLTPRHSLYLASTDADLPKIREEFEARKAAGFRLRYLTGPEIAERFDFARPAALYSDTAREIDPYRLTLALIRKARGLGLRVFTGADVTAYDADATGVTLRTADGYQVGAGKVVFATGYETPTFLRNVAVKLKSTYALASEPLTRFEGWFERCIIWESARPYFYLRGTLGGRAILGGGDEPFADPARRDALLPAKTAALADKFRTLFPRIDLQTSHAWAGTFAETPDGLPYIGGNSQFPHGYFALGYGGNGITFSLIAARIIQDLFMGRRNDDAGLFRFER